MNLVNETSWHEFQLIVWLDVYNESVCDLVMCKENVVFIRFLHAINACPLINWDAHREQVTLFWSAAKQMRLLICSAALPPPHLLSKKMRAIPFVTLTALTLLHHWKFIQYSVSAAWGNSCHFPAHTSTGKRSMQKALVVHRVTIQIVRWRSKTQLLAAIHHFHMPSHSEVPNSLLFFTERIHDMPSVQDINSRKFTRQSLPASRCDLDSCAQSICKAHGTAKGWVPTTALPQSTPSLDLHLWWPNKMPMPIINNNPIIIRFPNIKQPRENMV